MMATLNLLGFTMGLSIWLFSILVVTNALYASQVRSLCQEHQIKFNPLFSSPSKNSPHSPSSYGESVTISSQESKRRRGRV